MSFVRHLFWYAALVPLIAIYILPLFGMNLTLLNLLNIFYNLFRLHFLDPIEPRHALVVKEWAERGRYYNYGGHAIWYLTEGSKTEKVCAASFVLLHAS